MAFVTGSVLQKGKGHIYGISGFMEDCVSKIKLSDKLEYVIGIDQSSSCLGLYIADTGFNLHVMFDIQPLTNNKAVFYEKVYKFIKSLIHGMKVRFFITEDVPPPTNGRRHAYSVLKELKGVVSSWIVRFQDEGCLQGTRTGSILPNSWKSVIIKKHKGKGRFHDKESVVLDLLDDFPELAGHYPKCPTKDYDSFEAAGIVHGYLKTHFSGGRELIAGKKDFFGSVYVFYKALSIEEAKNRDILLDGFEVTNYNLKGVILGMNAKYSLYSNYKMAAAKHPFVISLISDELQSLSIRWQFNLGLDKPVIIAYIIRKNSLGAGELKMLSDLFPHDLIR